MMLVLVSAALMTSDPCLPIDAPSKTDSALAAIYQAVGDDERAAGRADTAAAAYRRALENDPANARAREGLAALCQLRPPTELFDHGVEHLQAGDWKGAAELFRQARAQSTDPAAALLEGIARYELGDDADALKALKEAEVDPSVSHAALLFRGLVAYRQNQRDQARELFRQASTAADPRLQEAARGLTRLTSHEGHLVFSAQAEVGYDSNASLAPSGDPSAPPVGDGYADASLTLTGHPQVTHGPFLGISAEYRKLFQLSAFDLGDVGGFAGWEFGGPTRNLSASYSFDALAFGERAYLDAHRLALDAQAAFGSFSLRGSATARRETYLQPDIADFSGWRMGGLLQAMWTFPGGSSIAADYQATYDLAQTTPLTYLEHGPHAALSWRATSRLRFGLEGYLWLRSYAAPGATESVSRQDTVIEGDGIGEYSFADHWSVRLTISARDAQSTDPEFTYSRYIASLGVTYLTGLF